MSNSSWSQQQSSSSVQSSRLQAIRINGAIVVESLDDLEEKRAERRRKRASRWSNNDNNNNSSSSSSSNSSTINNSCPRPLKRSHIVLGPEDSPNLNSSVPKISKSSSINNNDTSNLPLFNALMPDVKSDFSATPMKRTEEMSEEQLLRHQIDAASHTLSTLTEATLSRSDRSPSPEPVYDSRGKRVNTRLQREREKLLKTRNEAITRLKLIRPDYKPPSSYTKGLERRVNVPAKEHPDINFMGLLLGPRGCNLEDLKKRTNTQIFIRGQGSIKAGMTGISRSGKMYEAQDEEMHVLIKGNNMTEINKAAEELENLMNMEINEPDKMSLVRAQQMRKLAEINGTVINPMCIKCGLRDHKAWQCEKKEVFSTSSLICNACGGFGHLTSDCKQRRPGEVFNELKKSRPVRNEEMDSEYLAFLKDLGEEYQTGSSFSNAVNSGPKLMLQYDKEPSNVPQVLGKSIFGGNLTRLTSGYRTPAELERERAAQKAEHERRMVPTHWRTERAESLYNKQLESYYEDLERMAKLEALKKQQALKRPSPQLLAKNSRENNSEDLLPKVIGTPLGALRE